MTLIDHLQVARCAALALLAAAVAPALHAEGAFSQLYAARPPAGSSFVRVLNPGSAPLQVKIGQGPVQTISGDAVASSYAIVKGNTEFAVVLDGKAGAPMKVAPDSFTSLVPTSGSAAALRALDDSAGATQDALKAELRFYNLIDGCAQGKVGIAPAGTPLFAALADGGSAARAINPVKATLVGSCGEVSTAPLALPALQPGDHYSLFLTGTPARPILRGQRSTTDSYRP